MDELVIDVAVTLPERRAPQLASGPAARRPQATVTFSCERGHEASYRVPARVGRLYAKDVPELPQELAACIDQLRALERKICFAHLVEMLSRREHGEAEVKRKLASYGYRQSSIDAAVERAQDLRFLDERRFVTAFVEERMRRGWGRRKIERELALRGVRDEGLLELADSLMSEDGERDRARDILARRRIPDDKAYEKLVRHLMTKGFSYGVASDAVKECLAQNGD